MINASPNFKRAWLFALRWEGGALENVPGDHGGLTRYGVDQASHPHVDIRALTADQAGQIYHDDEWTRCRCDSLPDDLAVALFDFAMNAGCGPAVRAMQETLRVQSDGFLGPQTMGAVLMRGRAPHVVPEFLDRRVAFYRGIAAAHPDQAQFLKGWLNRVEALRQTLMPAKPLPVAALPTALGTAGKQVFTAGNASGKGGAASGSVGLAVPLCLSAAVAGWPLLADATPSQQTLTWIGGFVGFLAIVKLLSGIAVDRKKLNAAEPVASVMPQPLVVREADQFATQAQLAKIEKDMRNQMVELRNYVHDAVHEIRNLASTMTNTMREQVEDTRDHFDKLDARNEQRVEKLAHRVDDVINAMPEKIINLLKNTGAIGNRV